MPSIYLISSNRSSSFPAALSAVISRISLPGHRSDIATRFSELAICYEYGCMYISLVSNICDDQQKLVYYLAGTLIF